MNVLFISPVVPYPLTDGGRQRLHNLLQALLDDHRVFFAGFSKTSEDSSSWPLAKQLAGPPLIVKTDADGGAGRSGDVSRVARAAGLSGWARPAAFRKVAASALWRSLRELPLSDIDVVHVATTLLAPFAVAIKRNLPETRLVLDLPDVAWHMRYRVVTSVDGWWRRRSGLTALLDTARWHAFETSLLPHFDRILVCSDVDRQRISRWVAAGRTAIVPNGTDVHGIAVPAPSSASRDLVFVGAMSYQPNEEGVKYFCDEVWPRVLGEVPDARFWIVGKDPSRRVQSLASERDRIIVTGGVPDVRPFLERSVAVVVPLLSGGGTRLKVLEAMAAGRPVVATSIGIEGIEAVPGRDYLLGDTARDFARACILLLEESDRRRRISEAARRLVASRYDWRAVHDRLRTSYSELQVR